LRFEVPLRYGADDVFEFDAVVYVETLEKSGWEVRLPVECLGKRLMAVFVDIYGNEAREVILAAKFGEIRRTPFVKSASGCAKKKNGAI
jgi:hypothetical protein